MSALTTSHYGAPFDIAAEHVAGCGTWEYSVRYGRRRGGPKRSRFTNYFLAREQRW